MKIGSNISNRTKVLGGVTILIGAATLISGIKDHRELKALEADNINDVVEEVREGIEDAIDELPATEIGEVIDF